MRLGDFEINDKVYFPAGDPSESRYSTVLAIGEFFAFLKPEYGAEFSLPVHEEGFERYKTEEELREDICKLTVLGRDLIAAIELSVPHHTPSLTLHMQTAIANFRQELRHV